VATSSVPSRHVTAGGTAMPLAVVGVLMVAAAAIVAAATRP
jgi:hypothetical protein